jgi:hypothetical protein
VFSKSKKRNQRNEDEPVHFKRFRGTSMKKIAITVFITISLMITSPPAFGYVTTDLEVIADVLIVRPVSLAATVVGTVVFIVALPISITSGSVGTAARTVVVVPFKYTFTRPIGEFSEDWERSKDPGKDP